jgi:formylglycine-generating enzyme required for sulfatase activity
VLVALSGGAGAWACQAFDGISDDLVYAPDDAAAEAAPPDASRDGTMNDGVAPADATLDAATGDGGTADVRVPLDATDGSRDANDAADAYDPYRGCPQEAGTTMVRIDVTGGGAYCIDVTEVTYGQFSAYLNAYQFAHGTFAADLPDLCKSDARDDPDPPVVGTNVPVSQVGYCFAWDYCAWVGKRLCGARGGGDVMNVSDGEWYYACANGLASTTYPYGTDYDASACVTNAGVPAPVGTYPQCRGLTPPFNLIYDMSGNIREYEREPLTNEFAATVGGDYTDPAPEVRCLRPDDNNNTGVYNRNLYVGIRCCADAH